MVRYIFLDAQNNKPALDALIMAAAHPNYVEKKSFDGPGWSYQKPIYYSGGRNF
jgi:hypothetical protein